MSKFAVKLLSGRVQGLAVLTLLIFLCLVPGRRLMAQDTVSSADVQFAAAPASSMPEKKITGKQQTFKAIPAPVKKAKNAQTIWSIFIAGLFGGFAALLMPCIFPMLPLTVSYFTKNGKGAVTLALLYG